MRDILAEETCLYTKGVQDTDVDWFITDSSIDPNADVQPLVSSPRETNLNSKQQSQLHISLQLFQTLMKTILIKRSHRLLPFRKKI